MTPLQRRSLLFAPFGLAVLGGSAMWVLISRASEGNYNPHAVPDPMVGKPVPQFSLPGLTPTKGFTRAELVQNAPLLLNFFASWCLPCANEVNELIKLKQRGIPIWGVVYKDKPAAAAAFLKEDGNPYHRLDVDERGLTAINFGLYGVPETYLVDKHGILRWRWPGALTPSVVRERLDPLLKTYAPSLLA